VVSSNIAMLGALIATTSGSAFLKAGAWSWVLVGLAAAGCISSIAMAALAAFPRPGTRHGSLIFFGSIATMARDDYFNKLRAVPQMEFARDLADQCHRVAVIAALKFRWVRRAMVAMIVAAVPWLICLEMAGWMRGH